MSWFIFYDNQIHQSTRLVREISSARKSGVMFEGVKGKIERPERFCIGEFFVGWRLVLHQWILRIARPPSRSVAFTSQTDTYPDSFAAGVTN